MRLLLGGLIVASIASFVWAQDPVFVDVVVRTKSGPVTGLTKDDFVLKDKGKVQKVEVFAATAAHDSNFQPMPLNPSVGSNRLNWRGETVRTGTVILFDRLNTPIENQSFTRQQVIELLASLKETDSVAFLSLSRGITVVNDFFSDPGPLIRSARRLAGMAGAPAPGEVDVQQRLESALTAAQQIDPVARPALTQAAFRAIALHLAGVPGRKSLIWMARSFPLTFPSDPTWRRQTDAEFEKTAAILQAANVAVYPVSPGGVGSGFDDTATQYDVAADSRLRVRQGVMSTITPPLHTLSDTSNMQRMADATGGKAFYNINDVVPVSRAILDENELVYTLGFQPDPKSLDELMHGLDVDLAEGKGAGAEVRFRKKYLATKQNTRPAITLGQLAAEPLEATGIGMTAVAQPDAAKPGFQKVTVSISPADLGVTHAGDKWTSGFELGLFIDGAPAGSSAAKTFDLSLTDDQWKQVQASGLIVEGSVPSKGIGDTIHVVVMTRGAGAQGSARVPAR